MDPHRFLVTSRQVIASGILLLAVSTNCQGSLDEAMMAIRMKDFESAVTLLQPLSDSGNSEAQYRLGILYLRGLSGDPDTAHGVRLLQSSAASAHPLACYELGRLFEQGESVPQDVAAALHWYNEAARRGNSRAKRASARLLSKLEDTTTTTAVFAWIRNGQQDAVKNWLQREVRSRKSLNEPGPGGVTLLQYAVRSGDLPITELLLNAGASPNIAGVGDEHPLIIASRRSSRQLIERLIDAGASLNATDEEGNTALHLAAASDNREVVEILLKSGADPGAKNRNGSTAGDLGDNPLLLSTRSDQQQSRTAPEGDESQANLISPLESHYHGWTPLNIAAWRGQLDMVNDLIQLGENPNEPDTTGWTPMARAAAQGHEAIVVALLRAGAKVEAHGENSPVELAINGPYPAVAQLLLEHTSLTPATRISLLKKALNQNLTGLVMTALWDESALRTMPEPGLLSHAANQQAGALVLGLVALSWPVNDQDEWHRSPLWWSVFHGNQPTVAGLLKAGADPNQPDSNGDTPLIVAVRQDHPDIAGILLAQGAAPDLPNAEGNTPLMVAANRGNRAIAELLIDAGADLRLRNNLTQTPLMMAAAGDHAELVRYLIKRGADPGRRNSDGRNAEAIAEASGSMKALRVLQETH